MPPPRTPWTGTVLSLLQDLSQIYSKPNTYLIVFWFFYLLPEMLVEGLWRWLPDKDADKKRMIVLTSGQADSDVDRAQLKSDLEELAVRPTYERLTQSRDLWPNLFYLLHFLFKKKYFNKSYILKMKF